MASSRLSWLVALRARLGVCALALAVCQVAGVTAAGVVVASKPSHATVADEECTCEHETGVMCPMHRSPNRRPLPAGTPRWHTGCDQSVYVLAPIWGVLTLPERPMTAARPGDRRVAVRFTVVRLVPSGTAPDSPPPRA